MNVACKPSGGGTESLPYSTVTAMSGRPLKSSSRTAISVQGEAIPPATEEQVAAFLKQGLSAATPERVSVDVTWEPDNRPSSQVTVDARYAYDSILAPIMPLEGIILRCTQTTVVIN